MHNWESITGRPSTYTPSAHNHNDIYYTESELNNLLAGYSKTNHNHDSVYATLTHSHTWDSVSGKPSTFTPSSHNHSWSEISGKPSTFTPSAHNHNDIYYTKEQSTTIFSPITVFLSEDIGEDITVIYPNNTLICVYEDISESEVSE